MKVTLNREKLKSCLHYTSMIIDGGRKGGVSPLYTQVQFDFIDNILVLSSYDSAYGLQIVYGEANHPNARFLVDSESISHLMTFSDEVDLEFDFKEASLVIKEGKSKYRFTYFKTEGADLSQIFSNCIDLKEPILTTTPEEFEKIAKFLEPAIANDAARPYLNGIQYDGNFVSASENVCGIVSAKPVQEKKIFLVSGGLDLIYSLPQGQEISIYDLGRLTAVKSGVITIIMPQISGEFPTYSRIIDKTSAYPYSFDIKRSAFQKMCAKLVPFSDKHHLAKASVVFTKDSTVVLHASSEDREGTEPLVALSCVPPTTDLSFLVNIKRFEKIIGVLPTDTLTIKYSDDIKAPLVLTDNKNFYGYFAVYSPTTYQ